MAHDRLPGSMQRRLASPGGWDVSRVLHRDVAVERWDSAPAPAPCLAVRGCYCLDAPQFMEGHLMRRSTTRILTTHTGSLPRPAKVVEQLLAGQRSGAALDAAVGEAVADGIAKQKAA